MTNDGLQAETRTLGDELARLDAERRDLADRLRTADEDGADVAMLKSELRDLDQAGRAVGQLVEEYGEDATATFRGLAAGEYAKVENKTAEANARVDSPGGVPGTAKIVFAAAGLVNAPFYDGDEGDLNAKIEALSEQSVGVRTWLEDVISEKGTPDPGNWQPLDELLQDTVSRD